MCLSVNPHAFDGEVERWGLFLFASPEHSCFLWLKVMQGVSLAWLYSDEPRTESSGLAPNDPAVKHRDISISAGDATCQQNADGKMKGIQKERLSDYFKFIRATEGGRTPMRGTLLTSNYFQLSLCVQLSVCLPVCILMSALDRPSVHLSVCQVVRLQPCSLAVCVWICSHATNSSAHWRCWHLLRDPGWWQGAQSLPEGQGAAGDQAPQSHGEGESLNRVRTLLLHYYTNKRDNRLICSVWCAT